MPPSVYGEWLSYEALIVPRGATDMQREECRRAFYAGAWALYWLVIGAAAHRDDAQCERELEAIRTELAGVTTDLAIGKK